MARKPSVIKREYPADAQVVSEKKTLREVVRRESLSDELANDNFFYKNKFFSELKEKNPHNKDLWHVDKYYPRAEGGPLAVDELNRVEIDSGALELTKKKAETFKELNLRYVVITPDKKKLDLLEELA